MICFLYALGETSYVHAPTNKCKDEGGREKFEIGAADEFESVWDSLVHGKSIISFKCGHKWNVFGHILI